MVQLDESYAYGNADNDYGRSIEAYNSYMQNNWTHIAETTMPLKESKLAAVNQGQFQVSLEIRSRQISTKVIVVNLISLLVNLLLAIIAFYFSFANNSPSTTAFAADCILDFISSAIVLWRYHGHLSSVYMQAREQIACIYLGALFEISSLAIIIKAISDVTSDTDFTLDAQSSGSLELVILASVATVACSILTVFKCALYKTLRDNSILLDVINTFISTLFALSIVLSQVLINFNPSFWYLDPILSIILAIFMMGFGAKVLHQNFNILKPIYYNQTNSDSNNETSALSPLFSNGKEDLSKLRKNSMFMNANLSSSYERNQANWQKTDYSTITFA